MKWWRILILAVAFGLATALLSTDGPRQVNERAVAIVTLPCETRLQSTSSGFVINDETVVTVAHALYESRDFAVRDTAGDWHDATILFMDLERDLALLSVPGLRADRAAMGIAEPEDSVRMLAGAASGTENGEVLRRVRITTEVIGDFDLEAQRSGYELSVEVASGDSGAGVIDDQDRLVGLIFARSRVGNAAWATSSAEIRAVEQRRGVPHWDCAADLEAKLFLEPQESTELPGPVVN